MPIAGIVTVPRFRNRAARPFRHARRIAVMRPERRDALPMPSLEWTPEVERETAHLYERVKNVIPPVEWPFLAPYVQGDQRAEEASATR